MYENLAQANTTIRNPRQYQFRYGPWINGLVLSRTAEQMTEKELAEGFNFITVGRGTQRTRNGTELVFSGMDGNCVWCGEANIGGSWYTFAVDNNDSTYKLWFNISGTATAIGTLEGVAQCTNYLGYLIIPDKSYLKAVTDMTYVDWALSTSFSKDDKCVHNNVGYRALQAHTAADTDEPGVGDSTLSYWEATWIDLIYDQGGDGDGEGRPYQFNNRTGDSTYAESLDDSTVKIGYKFQSQAWTAGMKIPPTIGYAKMRKIGSPSGDILAVVQAVDDSTVLASGVIDEAEDLTAEFTEYTIAWSDSEITAKMTPGDSYCFSIDFTAGDSTNIVQVASSSATAGHIRRYINGVWSDSTLRDPVMGLKPGRPPKLEKCLVFDDRLWGIEGLDGDNPAYLWYCAAGSAGNVYDWSTSDGGGYLQAIDSNGNTFSIGAFGDYYDEIHIFGSQRQPYLAKVSGSSPSAYSVDKKLQMVYAHHKSFIITDNDIWYANKSGIDAISTVEAYGDIRTQKVSNRLHEKLLEKWDADAFAGYDPDFGTLLVKLTDYDNIVAINTMIKSRASSGILTLPIAPANEWQYSWSSENPTCFGAGNGSMLIGTDGGKVYKMSKTEVQDAGTDVTYRLWTNFRSTKRFEYEADLINTNIFGKFGGSFDIRFYRNHSRTEFSASRISKTLPWDTSTTPDELTMDVDEMGFLVNPENYYDRTQVEPFNFRSLMVGIENIQLNGAPIYISEITLYANDVGGL